MQEGFQNFNQANFDPNSLASMTSSVIMFTGVIDRSPSISSYVDAMNTAMSDVFMKELKNSHRKDDIIIKAVYFNKTVKHKSGFLPIANLQDDYLETAGTGSGTALYDAVLQALEGAIAYREDLENQGVDVRTNITIITDGMDNSSNRNAAKKVAAIVEDLRKNEGWINSFTITMIGVGKDVDFEHACKQMGLDPTKCLTKIGTSAGEIRKMMGVVSQSVSSSGAAAAVSF